MRGREETGRRFLQKERRVPTGMSGERREFGQTSNPNQQDLAIRALDVEHEGQGEPEGDDPSQLPGLVHSGSCGVGNGAKKWCWSLFLSCSSSSSFR